MRKLMLVVGLLLIAPASLAKSPWQSLQAIDPRTPDLFSVRATAASSDGYWLVDEYRQLHRFVSGQNEPALAPRIIPAYAELELHGLPGKRLLIVGSRALCSNTLQPCATEVTLLDEAGTALGEARLPGRCGAPVVAAGGEFSLACDGQLFHLSARADVLARVPGLCEQRYQHTDHAVMADGSHLLVVRDEDSVGVLSLAAEGHPRWQTSFPQDGAPPLFSESHLFLRLTSPDGSSELRVLRAADGFVSGELSITESVTAAAVWRGQIWLALENAQGEHHLDAFDVHGAITSTRFLGPDPVLRLAVNEASAVSGSELLLGLGGASPKLGRLDQAGNFRASSLGPIESLDGLVPLAQSQVLIVAPAPPAVLRSPQQVEVRDFDNQPVAEWLTQVPKPLDLSGISTLDVAAGELWLASGGRRPHLLRARFSDGETTVYSTESFSLNVRSPVGAPVATASHYCAGFNLPSEVLCQPRTPVGWAFGHTMLFPEAEIMVAMASDSAGRLNILTRRTSADQTILTRSVVTEQGVVERHMGDPLSIVLGYPMVGDGFRSLGGLRALVGDRLLVDGERFIAEVLEPQRQLRFHLGLPDGGMIVDTFVPGPGSQSTGLLERLDAQGQRVWSTELPPGLRFPAPLPYPQMGQQRLQLAASTVSLLLEPDAFPSIDPVRALFDLDTGQLLRTEPAFDDGQQALFTTVTPVGTDLWRLTNLSNGLVAQRISASQPRVDVWLPCLCGVLRNVASAGDGKTYFEFLLDHRVVLAVADLPTLALAQAPVRLDAGRLHADGQQIGGLLTARLPGSVSPVVLHLDWSSSDGFAPGQSRWDYLMLGDTGERSVNLRRRAPLRSQFATSLDDPSAQWSLLSLAGSAWLLRVQGDPYGVEPARLLQSNPQTAATRVYFADGVGDFWVAVDEVSGEGAWGLPNGRWYRLQRVSSERWIVHEVSAESSVGVRPSGQDAIGTAALRTLGCGQMDWRLVSIDGRVRPNLGAELGSRRQLQANCAPR